MTTSNDILPNEYAAFYANYIQLAPQNVSLIEAMDASFRETFSFFSSLTEEQGHSRYAKDKWSLKEMLLHIIDTERIMAYRALIFSRNDATDLPGFEQDEYVINSFADKRTILDLLDEYNSVRKASLTLFSSFDDTVMSLAGTANGNKMTVRALGFIICGHERHHLNIAKNRYF